MTECDERLSSVTVATGRWEEAEYDNQSAGQAAPTVLWQAKKQDFILYGWAIFCLTQFNHPQVNSVISGGW